MILHGRLRLFIIGVLIVHLYILLTACASSTSSPPIQVDAERSPTLGVSTPTAIQPSSTPTMTLTSTETLKPTVTLNPYGTPVAIETVGNITKPPGIDLTFIDDLTNFPTGNYILYEMEHGVGYTSVDLSLRGDLLTLSEGIGVIHFRSSLAKHIIVGSTKGYGRVRIDLWNKTATKFEPICSDRKYGVSVEGTMLGVVCTPFGEAQGGEFEVEVVSLEKGDAYHLTLPSYEGIHSNSNITWVSNDAFIVNAGVNEEPCLVDVQKEAMRCPKALRGGLVTSVSPDQSWMHAIGLTLSFGAVFPLECFLNEETCDNVILIQEDFIQRVYEHAWSADSSLLAVMPQDFHTYSSVRTIIAYYDTETWTPHLVADFFGGGYHLAGWCPDNKCVILAGMKQGVNGRVVYLDGRSFDLPFEYPIGAIHIP